MSDQQMILILVIAFFVLGCSFSCNGLKEDFAISTPCKAVLTDANLCAFYKTKRDACFKLDNGAQGGFIMDFKKPDAPGKACANDDINAKIEALWPYRLSCAGVENEKNFSIRCPWA